MRTGIDRPVEEPYRLSFAAVGADDVRPPRFRPSMVDLRATLLRIRARHLAAGFLEWHNLAVIRFTTAGKQESWGSTKDARFPEDRWVESLDGVPELFDTVTLAVTQWGEIRWKSPLVNRHDAYPRREVRANLRSDDSLVVEDAHELREALRRTALVDGVQTGFVHIDGIADPYTRIVTERSVLAENRFDREVHGYYWCVLLTEGQVDALGGAARLQREAPCERIEPVDGPNGESFLCTLTEDPASLRAEVFEAWRSFLAPVLRRGYPGSLETCGKYFEGRGGLLRQPVWLFEGPPAPELAGELQRGEGTCAPIPIVREPGALDGEELCTMQLALAPAFDVDPHTELVDAVLAAWRLVGRCGLMRVDDDDDGDDADGDAGIATGSGFAVGPVQVRNGALCWTLDQQTAADEVAVHRLALALGRLEAVLSAQGEPRGVRAGEPAGPRRFLDLLTIGADASV